MMEVILEKIRDFADKAHGEQMRKYTHDRYIVHPVRVMEICKEYTSDQAMLAAALLHDVLEDTPVTPDELQAFLRQHMDAATADKTLQLVVELTDVYVRADFPKLNRRARKQKEAERMEKTSGDAQTIKYADIIDNSREITQQDVGFAPVFLRECHTLLKKMRNGHPVLRERAVKLVEGEIKKW